MVIVKKSKFYRKSSKYLERSGLSYKVNKSQKWNLKITQKTRFCINAILSSIFIDLIVGLSLFYLLFHITNEYNKIGYLLNQRYNIDITEISLKTIFGDTINSKYIILTILLSSIAIIPVILFIFNLNQLRLLHHSKRPRTKQHYIIFFLITFTICLFIIFHLLETIFSALKIYNSLVERYSYLLKNQYPLIAKNILDYQFLYIDILFFIIISMLLLTMVVFLHYSKSY
ncbi:hypothetical protein LCGC14_1721650 [marine sediment metagenome]|uniref:Uncharacterized protein n=1 Tax=marine sediment metagenome TaxID=412755 RepID=A0A0F9HC11_9ZZZZ